MSARIRPVRPARYSRPRRRTVPRSARPAATSTERPRAVVVATDGSRLAGAAIRLAYLMASERRWEPQTVTVLEPLPVSVADMTLGPPTLGYQQEVTDSLLGTIQSHLKRNGGGEWPLSVQFGRPAPVVARFARDARAGLIVLGLGHHGRLARLVGAETAARVVRVSDVPVLAVAEGTRSLPFTALVAMDFGDSSVRAAREALALLEPPGRLHLLHVRWAANGQFLTDAGWERTYAAGVARGFERVTRELGSRDGIRVSTEFRVGSVVETILAVARKIGADVIAAGSHSQTVIDRLILGSTPAQLLRAAPCSVLITPPAAPVAA